MNLLSESVFSGPTSPVPSPGNGAEPASGPAQPKKIRGIGFGDIFKEGSVKLKTRSSSTESEDKKPDKVCSGSYCYFLVSCKNNLKDVESEGFVQALSLKVGVCEFTTSLCEYWSFRTYLCLLSCHEINHSKVFSYFPPCNLGI